MVSQNYDFVARRLVTEARNMPVYPKQELTLVEWKNNQYFGHIQHIYEEHLEIVNLSKTSIPISVELTDSIRRVEPSILQLKADNNLDLEGRTHILRKLENRLTILTPEQTKFVLDNPIGIIEL